MLYLVFQASVAAEAPRELERAASFGEWLRHDIQYCRFKSYDLTYALYSKFPSWGSAEAHCPPASLLTLCGLSGPSPIRPYVLLLSYSSTFCSAPDPGLLFSWWRNKISWSPPTSIEWRMRWRPPARNSGRSPQLGWHRNWCLFSLHFWSETRSCKLTKRPGLGFTRWTGSP